jgi:outer membrane protein insertion porin family
MILRLKRPLGLLLAGALSGPVQAQTQVSSALPRISAIELTGSSDPTLVRYLPMAVGASADPEAIRSSVLLLSAMDLFDDVQVEQEKVADGTVRLVFSVQQTPRLGDLTFVTRGNEGGPDSRMDSGDARALAQASGLRRGDLFRDGSLADAESRMTTWLRENAYSRARLAIEVAASEDAETFTKDIRVRILDASREALISARIEGWPSTLVPPPSPGDPGDPLTAENLQGWKESLLRRLWKAGHYRAQIRTESVRGDLVFFVNPGPSYELKLDSLVEKERSAARARFEKEGLSQDAIEETMSAIEADFVKRGYRDVEVDFQEAPRGDRALGDFVVRQGPQWILAAIEYQTDGSPSPRPSPLRPAGPWIDADIEAEKTRLLAELVKEGHAGASVTHEESGEPANGKILFKIVPGALTVVGSVVIEGSPPLEARSTAAAIELVTRETSPFRNADVARDRTALLTSLRDDGYVDARVEATTDFSDDRSTVAVVFHVIPGPRVRVGRIIVVGLEDTRETVVLRESRLKEGDYLSYQKLLDTQSGLSATGLFTNVQIRELPIALDQRDLIIEIKEGPRTTIVPGLGYAETEKARASLEFTRLNISGLGRSASLFLRGSIKGSSRALLSLTEPYAFGRRQAVNVQLYWDDDRSRRTFDFHRLGFQTQTIFPVRAGNILAHYTFQRTTTINKEKDCAQGNRDLCDGQVSGPSLGFVHDTRNDALDPRRGTLYSLETLLSLEALGGDSFLKGSAFIARYEELRAGFVLAGSARVGLARALGSSLDLPLPERFFAGGASLMRGFGVDEVGPGRFNEDGLFIPEGGKALVAAAIEARINISRLWGFQLFAETGGVFSRTSAIGSKELREVAGVGITYRSPFGPLRLDWGFKLDKRPGEGLQQLHVGVGYAF